MCVIFLVTVFYLEEIGVTNVPGAQFVSVVLEQDGLERLAQSPLVAHRNLHLAHQFHTEAHMHTKRCGGVLHIAAIAVRQKYVDAWSAEHKRINLVFDAVEIDVAILQV